MNELSTFNLHELACIAQGGHRSGTTVKGCRREGGGFSEFWLEYRCLGCGVWIKDIKTYSRQPIDTRVYGYQESIQEYIH